MKQFENAKVLVKQGWLQGYVDGKLKIFKGVPYAAPPVGNLRFRHPVDPQRWKGVRKATEYSAAAIQPVMEDPEAIANVHGVPQMLARSQYEEDCLYLNIWSPAKTAEDKLPVFIWVHGGGMVAGSGVECVCDGDGLAKRKDMIVVTINYRLGFFGFFAHPKLTEEGNGTSGNYALYDIRKACEWVKNNIEVFGGDPENITVAGQSGGAAAVGTLHASPLMKGLIQHVSIESGPIFWGFMQPQPRENLERKGIEFMEKAGINSIDVLRRMDAWDLFDKFSEIYQNPAYFSFCIDGEYLPEKYTDIMEQGKFNDFDVMIGSCAQEFLVGSEDGIPVERYEKILEEYFPDNLDNMKKWYPAENPVQARKQLTTIASDAMLMGSAKIGELCHKYGRNAYVWLMNKENETEKGRRIGSPHCAEMPYVFGRVDTGEQNPFFPYHWVGKDYDFMEFIQERWYNFSKYGNPNGEKEQSWKKYEQNFDICILGNNSHMIPEEQQEKYRYYYKKLNAGETIDIMRMMFTWED